MARPKESGQFDSLKTQTPATEEEFNRLCSKLPDLKIRPERVVKENIIIKDKTRFRFKTAKPTKKTLHNKFSFLNPLPVEMQVYKLNDFAAVHIDWKMLTTVRPKTRVEEEYFSRLVELRRHCNKNRRTEKRNFLFDSQMKKVKNKAGIVELRVTTCQSCGEEFCKGDDCARSTYDSCSRIKELDEQKVSTQNASKSEKRVEITKRMKRKKRKSNTCTSKKATPLKNMK